MGRVGPTSAPRLQLPAWFWGPCHLNGHRPSQHSRPQAALWVGTQQSTFHATSTWAVRGGLCPLESHGCMYASRGPSRTPPGRASPARSCPPPPRLFSGLWAVSWAGRWVHASQPSNLSCCFPTAGSHKI